MPRCDRTVTRAFHRPVSSFDQHVLSKFMNITPKVLGAIEILISIVMLVIVSVWTKLYILWSCLLTILTGSVTVTAACMQVTCLVRISQLLNWFNGIGALMSIPFHLFKMDGVTTIILLVCDLLIFIVSVIVASSSCECCRTKPRRVQSRVNYIEVSYLTDEYTVVQGRRGPFTPPSSYYECPLPTPVYNLHPSAPPASYISSPPSPPPSYDAVPSAPPLNYLSHPSAAPLNYNPGPSDAPPAYEDIKGHFVIH